MVLVEREIDKWYASFEEQVIRANETLLVYILTHYIEPFVRAHPASLMRKMEYGMFKCSDQAGFRARATETYREHYAKVRRMVPKERLLEYRLGSGWGPLCKFIGKEVPAEEFPFLNEKKEFAIWMKKIQQRELRRGLSNMSYLLVPGAIIGAAWILKRMW